MPGICSQPPPTPGAPLHGGRGGLLATDEEQNMVARRPLLGKLRGRGASLGWEEQKILPDGV